MGCEAGCNKMTKVETKIGVHCEDIKGLKHLYKPVWGMCVIFVIIGALIIGLWQDVRVSSAKISVHEQQDNGEFYSLNGRISTTEGKYETIITMLKNIQADQKEILVWQRNHKQPGTSD